MVKQFLLIPVFSLLLINCSNINPENIGSHPVEHDQWSQLLGKHVDDKGMVNYKAFIADSILLNNYLQILTQNAPNKGWTNNQQLAYWINLYNAFTVKLIITHYPVKSIKDIGSALQIPFVNTPWQIELIEISNNTYSLDDIEHKLIRPNFQDPRIHFALVCAAKSCPKLLNRAYRADKLDEQLNLQAKVFLSDVTKNKISENHIRLSKIFKWYQGDFTKNQTLIAYLNKFSDKKIKKNAKVEYLTYNWELNEQTVY